ncbi:probable H/ACA ribonucleoprotein complex subunit 1 [Amyelois transitella]|uniref:probable H/ACA ribonucleoprotein complex subunit 1 n=1 Tax=Amyelois transitella TaxID=680683 RepID=UPI00298FD6CC|nr:probable H/ACA ribonucleoprotein complex subunit 1 [Amyelois transitella]
MRAFVVLACVALAYGRPEPPVGYSYSAPSTRYSAPSSSYGAPSAGGHRIVVGGHSGGLSFGGGHSSGIISGGHSSGGLSLGAASLGGGHSGGLSFGGGDSGFGGGYAGGYSGAPLVQKHIYVHVPPPEPVEQRAPRIPAVAPPQKHYKIIFIKAPTPPTPVAPIIPVQPQNEEKTLVYVLVKKPEEQPDIVIPTPAPTQPSKPEVYFIKYQTQKESGGAIGGGAIGGGSIGGGDLGGIALGAGSAVGGGAGGHGGDDIGADFGASGGDSGSEGAHGGATSTQYGPPGHVAGPLH